MDSRLRSIPSRATLKTLPVMVELWCTAHCTLSRVLRRVCKRMITHGDSILFFLKARSLRSRTLQRDIISIYSHGCSSIVQLSPLSTGYEQPPYLHFNSHRIRLYPCQRVGENTWLLSRRLEELRRRSSEEATTLPRAKRVARFVVQKSNYGRF